MQLCTFASIILHDERRVDPPLQYHFDAVVLGPRQDHPSQVELFDDCVSVERLVCIEK